MSIIIEEIVYNPLIQIDETIEEITIPISEMQMPGATGADGKSAYQSALDGGFVGTELEFNQFLSEVDQKLNISDYNDRFKGVFLTLEALNLAHPTGIAGDSAQVNEVGVTDVINYSWDAEENIWVQSGASGSAATNTDALPEGTSNLYFTTARVLSTFINGVSFLIGTPIVSTDSILVALGKLQKQISDNLVLIGLKQNTLTNPLTGAGSNLDPTTYALQDGTILYHSVKWFAPTEAVSTSGTTVTSVGTQFTSAMVGAKLIINGEWRIITGHTSTTVVTVAIAYSQNYSGVVAGSWGVYSKERENTGGYIKQYTSFGFMYLSSELYTLNSINNFNTILKSQVGTNGNTKLLTIKDSSNLDKAYIRSDGTIMGQNVGTTDNALIVMSQDTNRTGLNLANNAYVMWSSANAYYNTKDLGLRRNAAGVLEIYDGITATGLEANRRDLLVRNITASQYKLNALNTAPASATDTGALGEIRVTATHIYVCTATNTWVRTALTTW